MKKEYWLIGVLVVLLCGAPLDSWAMSFSVNDVKGCYAATLQGHILDPASLQTLPTTSLVRFCADGEGNGSQARITQNVGGCFILEQRQEGAVTYKVWPTGQGLVEAEVLNYKVTDLCGGMMTLDIGENERGKFILRFILDKDMDIQIIARELILLDVAAPYNRVPLVMEGIAKRQ